MRQTLSRSYSDYGWVGTLFIGLVTVVIVTLAILLIVTTGGIISEIFKPLPMLVTAMPEIGEPPAQSGAVPPTDTLTLPDGSLSEGDSPIEVADADGVTFAWTTSLSGEELICSWGVTIWMRGTPRLYGGDLPGPCNIEKLLGQLQGVLNKPKLTERATGLISIIIDRLSNLPR